MAWQAETTGDGKAHLIGLDLLRALAILFVLIAHFGDAAFNLTQGGGLLRAITGLAGGYGVEIFFVLSGFLIGGLLLEIVARGPTLRAWRIFMVRRWMRTLPLYVLWIAVLLVLRPPQQPIATALKYLALLQNLAWPMPDDNWFAVSWSLTVEEWFYLLFSALLLGLAAYRSSRAIAIACAVFILLPLLARLLLPHGDLDYGLRKVVMFRLDAIAYGVVMIVAWRSFPDILRRWRYALLALGLAIAALPSLAAFQHLGAWAGPLMFSLIPLGLSLALPWATALRIPFALLIAPIRWLAGRSYCLYIIHVTIQQMFGDAVRGGYLGAATAGAGVILTCALLAELSYRYFEGPIMRRRPAQFPREPQGISAPTHEIAGTLAARQAF